MIERRGFRLAHRAPMAPAGSWAAVGPNGTGPHLQGLRGLIAIISLALGGSAPIR